MRRKYERKVPGKGYIDRRRIVYDRKEPKYDYLKYLRVVRYWVKQTYGVGLADLEMLLFLYNERLFKRSDFNEYEELFSWDVLRFNDLLRDGWISKWRNHRGSEAALYEVLKGNDLSLAFIRN